MLSPPLRRRLASTMTSLRAPTGRAGFSRSKGVLVAGVLSVGALAACGGNPLDAGAAVLNVVPSATMAVDAGVLIATDKTIIDHGASLITGKDCSTVRATDGGYYCEERLPDNTIVETRLYCYRSLGSIECYDSPQPYRENARVAPSKTLVGSRTEPLDR